MRETMDEPVNTDVVEKICRKVAFERSEAGQQRKLKNEN